MYKTRKQWQKDYVFKRKQNTNVLNLKSSKTKAGMLPCNEFSTNLIRDKITNYLLVYCTCECVYVVTARSARGQPFDV